MQKMAEEDKPHKASEKIGLSYEEKEKFAKELEEHGVIENPSKLPDPKAKPSKSALKSSSKVSSNMDDVMIEQEKMDDKEFNDTWGDQAGSKWMQEIKNEVNNYLRSEGVGNKEQEEGLNLDHIDESARQTLLESSEGIQNNIDNKPSHRSKEEKSGIYAKKKQDKEFNEYAQEVENRAAEKPKAPKKTTSKKKVQFNTPEPAAKATPKPEVKTPEPKKETPKKQPK